MGTYYRFESNPFWHLEWRDFDTASFIRTTLRLLGVAIIVQIGLATLLLIVKPNMFWVGTNLLLVALTFHLIAINHIDQQAPKRSFFDDAQRGSLDFLRLLPVSGHELVIARKLPFWFLRLFVAGLWTPIYLTAFGLVGLPPILAIPTSLLLGTASWGGIYLLAWIFLMPRSGDISLIAMFLLTTIYSSEGIQRLDESLPERQSPFFAAVLTTLTILSLLILIALQFSKFEMGNGAFNFFGPQPFYRFELTPIWACFWLMMAVGWARVDRLARWLEMPKGFRRFLSLPSLFTILFLSQGYIWGWLQQIEKWRPEDCFSASAAFTFAFGGILHWLWFNWTWAEKTPPEKPPIEWLTETLAWRTVTLIVPLLGCWLTSLPLSHLDIGFLNLWLMISVLDAFSLALTKSMVLKVLVQHRLKAWDLLSIPAFIPILGLIFKSPFPIAFSPSLALLALGWEPFLASVTPLKVGKFLSISVPNMSLWAAMIVPTLRVALTALVWQTMKSPISLVRQKSCWTAFSRAFSIVQSIAKVAFVLPALEQMLLARSQNPVFRHMVTATRWRYGWLPYLIAFVFGFLMPDLLVLFASSLIASIPIFCLTTYLSIHSYLRKLHQTGELWQWLITPLPSKTIVNGWRYGGWWWQIRWLGFILWLLVGGIVKGNAHMPKIWLFSTPLLALVAIFALLVLATMIMGAVTVAISDALREPERAFSVQNLQWSRSKALALAGWMTLTVFVSICSFGLFWLVAWLVGMAIAFVNIDTAVKNLDQIRKAPMERLPLK